MGRLRSLFVIGLVVLLVHAALAASKKNAKKETKKKAEFIDAMEHDIQVVTPTNFDHNIRKFRDDRISAVMFFKPDDDTKKIVDGWYNKVAKELKGMIKISAVNCEDFPVFCKEHNIKSHPSIHIYPPNPLPVVPYEAELTPSHDHKKFVSALTRYIPSSNIKNIDDASIDEFLASETGKPKILLFSDKKGYPTIYRALSSHFKKEMKFGFVKAEQKNIVSRYKVTNFPTVLAVRPNKKVEHFKSDKMDYTALYDWMNVFSETFVGGGGFSDAKGSGGSGGKPEEVKPWTVQRIPEVTKASHGDVCFKRGEGLCVIFLKNNARLEAAEEQMLDQLRERHTSHLADRGTTFRWMWMDIGIETEFAKLFDVATTPTVVVFNPHKRLRFTKMDADVSVSEQSVKNLIDRITGGDARFKMVPGQKLPEFANRAAKAKDEL